MAVKKTTPQPVKQEVIVETVVEEVKVQSPKVKQKRDMSEIIPVKNNTHRKLIYVSKRMQWLEVEWEDFGDVNYMELIEVQSMINSYPTFYKECWIMLNDEDLEFFNIKSFYESAIDMENFDSIFNKEPKELQSLLEKLPQSMKMSVMQRAKQLIDNGTIDSMKTIKVLNDTLNIDLSI